MVVTVEGATLGSTDVDLLVGDVAEDVELGGPFVTVTVAGLLPDDAAAPDGDDFVE